MHLDWTRGQYCKDPPCRYPDQGKFGDASHTPPTLDTIYLEPIHAQSLL